MRQPRARYFGRGIHRKDRSNKTESARALLLRSQGCRVVEQPGAIRLGHNLRFEPDLEVYDPSDESITYEDVKTAWKDKKTGGYKIGSEDDATVKIKTAAEQRPWFRFRQAAKLPAKAGGGWIIREMGLPEK